MAKILLTVLLFTAFSDQPEEGWKLFSKVTFKSVFFKQEKEYFLVPVFDSAIKSKQGIEIKIKGYYMAVDMKVNSLILSKVPSASCFFCGGAGPESIAEVVLKSKRPKLKADQIITVTGILKLNDLDIDHLNFILEDAEIVTH